MKKIAPTILDVTHSVQKPNQTSGVTGGNPEYIESLARAGIVNDVDGIFLETHTDPSKSKSDGANIIDCFIHITLPYMRPVIIVTVLIRLIFAIKTYDLIYIMTKGGPGDATDLISYYIYRSAFISLNLGEAAAMSSILLLIIIIITIPLFRYMNRLD